MLAEETLLFGPWLRQERTARGLTQAALAQRVGCATDVLRKFEGGAKRPSQQLAERLASELGLSADERAAFVQAARAMTPGSARQAPMPPERAAPGESREDTFEGAPATLLARTKLHPPRVRADVVPRPRLLDAMRHALETASLLLISAPAGSGKTTLLASAAVKCDDHIAAWLALDEDDNDHPRFLHALVAALDHALPGCGRTARQVLGTQGGLDHSDGPALGRQVITALINDLHSMLRQHVVLVLDDLHVITEPAVHASLDYFLERLPEGLTVAIGTRVDPPLALSRLRARRALYEVRLPELRFTVDETASLLNERLRLRLLPDEMESLHRWTEGWAAGLTLLAASLERIGAGEERRRFLEHAAHSEHYVFEYLADEVLSREDPFVRMFLLETAILPELTPEVCRRITGRDDAGAILDDLYRRNLFLIACEQDGGSLVYRYHDLFATFLRARLQRELPEWTRELHRRAAQADPVAARRIYHYMQAALWDEAARTIEQLGEQLATHGAVGRVRTWIEGLPPEVRQLHPRLDYLLGICALQIWELDRAITFFERALDGYRAAGNALGQGEALACLAVCRSTSGDFAGAREATEAALAFPTPPHLRVNLLIGRAWQALATGGWRQMSADVDAVLALADASDDLRALHAFVVNYHSPIAVLPGGMARSERLSRLVARVAPDSEFLQAAADVQRAWIHVWRNEWDKAVALGERVLAVNDRIGGLFGSAVEIYIMLPLLAAMTGQTERADAGFSALFDGLARPEAAAWTRAWGVGFEYVRGRVRWHQGRLAEARASYDRMLASRHDQEWPHVPAVVAAMRGLLLLSEQQYDDAEVCFREAVAIQDAIRLPLLYSDMRLLLAFCYLQANRSPEALRALEPALDEHVTEGTPGRIRTEGPRVAVPLLRLAAANGLHPGFSNDLLRSMDETPIDGELGGVRVPETGEILTERELDVLRLLAAGASNGAIAERLVISVHTVKSHVAHVLAKLHASSRAEAGARARDWRLI